MTAISYIRERLNEPSTIAGLGLITTSIATALNSGGSKQAFAEAGLQLAAGMVAAMKPDPVKAQVIQATQTSVSDQVAMMAAELTKVAQSVAAVTLKPPGQL